jgi:oligoribonuclease
MKKLIWLDLETTGLDEREDEILEVGVVITDERLDELSSHSWVVHQSDYTLARMNDWCVKNHTASGLVDEVRASTVHLYDVNLELCKLIHREFGRQSPVLFGSSIHFDRRFIRAHLDLVEPNLHHRMVDVSAIAEALRHMYGFEVRRPVTGAHRAIEDIRDSIGHLSELRKCFTFEGQV